MWLRLGPICSNLGGQRVSSMGGPRAAAGPFPNPHLPGPTQPRGGRDSFWWRLKELQDSKEQAAPPGWEEWVGRGGPGALGSVTLLPVMLASVPTRRRRCTRLDPGLLQ